MTSLETLDGAGCWSKDQEEFCGCPARFAQLHPADLLKDLERLGCFETEADNKTLTRASRSQDRLTRFGKGLQHPRATDARRTLLSKDDDHNAAAATIAMQTATRLPK